MKSLACRKTQQNGVVALSINLWNNFSRSSLEDISGNDMGSILPTATSFPMKLYLLSIFVWGVNNEQSVGVICDYINPTIPKIGFLCVKEHKLRGVNKDMIVKMLWRSDASWSIEVTPSNKTNDIRIALTFSTCH